jgi:hypothetical protein
MENKKITFYNKTIDETYKIINSNEDGLSAREAGKRLELY